MSFLLSALFGVILSYSAVSSASTVDESQWISPITVDELVYLVDQKPLTNGKCKRMECPVFVYVSIEKQTMEIYIHGSPEPVAEFIVSTGKNDSTPELDLKPNGRVYDEYMSRSFPGRGYKDLGHMPYAIFLYHGIAIHGTTTGNFKKLGTPDSHGCVRLHPDNGFKFNRLVRHVGVKEVWVTIE